MNEVINSILEAESKADEIVKQALEKSKNDMLSGEDNAEEIKERAVTEQKENRKQKLSDAEKVARSEYASLIKQGEQRAIELKANAEKKVKAASEIIVGRIFD